MSSKSLFLGLAILVLPLRASAVIFFIDVNNSYNEIDAVEKAAKAEGKELVVLPKTTPAQARALRELLKTRKAAWDAFNKLNCQGQILCEGKFTSPACAKAADKANGLDADVDRWTKDKLSVPAMAKALKEVYAKGKKVTSVMISGEDGGSLFGAYGTVKYGEFKAAFDQVPQLRRDVRSLYLWGCYTGTSGRLDQHWDKILGLKDKLVVGFHDVGPADGSPPSLSLLKKMVKAEGEAQALRSKREVEGFFRKFPEAMSMNTSYCVNGHYVDSRNQSFRLDELEKLAAKCAQNYPHKLAQKYACYAEARAECPSPPADHHKSEVRDFYTWLRQNEVCLTNASFRKAVPDAPDTDSVMRLIFWDRVWSNFLRNYGSDMQKLNNLLQAAGLGEEYRFQPEKIKTRRDFSQWFQKAKARLAQRNDEKTKYVKDAMERVHAGMMELLPAYIPEEWITGASSKRGHKVMDVKAECKK